jgi:hypothetical protein
MDAAWRFSVVRERTAAVHPKPTQPPPPPLRSLGSDEDARRALRSIDIVLGCLAVGLFVLLFAPAPASPPKAAPAAPAARHAAAPAAPPPAAGLVSGGALTREDARRR